MNQNLGNDCRDIIGGVDGDIAVMQKLIDYGANHPTELTTTLTRLKEEVSKIKSRAVWDDYAGEFGPNKALMRYGARP